MDVTGVKLGKKAARKDPRTLRLARYLPPHLPPPPDMRDYTNGLTDWGVMANYDIGDCTIAAAAHAVQSWTANTTGIVTMSDADVIGYYSRWAGYDPGNESTDRGAVELDILNRWRKEGLSGHSLLGYAIVSPHDLEHVRQALCLLGGLYVGLALPYSAARQIGKVWEVIPQDGGPWGGHAVWVVGYDAQGPICITWGQLQRMSWAFWWKYCDECYGLLSSDWLKHFGGDETINLEALRNDLQAIANFPTPPIGT